MVVLFDFSLDSPHAIFEYGHDHEGATHKTAIAAFALALLLGDVPTILVFAATVALEP